MARPDSERLPPFSAEAEEAVIGSLLLRGRPDENALAEIPFLEPNDFFREKNKWLFEGIQALAQTRVGVDQITVAHWLKEHDRLAAIGGPAYLIHCLVGVATSYHLKYYAEIVHDLAERRRVIDQAGRMAAAAYSGSIPKTRRGRPLA